MRRFVFGGDEGGRTPYLLNAIQALYQLSYTPERWYYIRYCAFVKHFILSTTLLYRKQKVLCRPFTIKRRPFRLYGKIAFCSMAGHMFSD